MSNFFAAFAHECGQLFRRGNLRSLIVTLAVIAVFGILVPWRKGFDFLDTRFILAYCSIGLLFSGPLMAEILANDGPNNPAPIAYFARVALTALYGWAISTLMLLIGFAVVNLTHWFGKILLPPAPILIWSLALGLLASIFVAEFTAVLTLKYSPGIARIGLRVAFFGILALILFGPTSISDTLTSSMTAGAFPLLAWKIAAGLAIANTGLLIALQSITTPKGDA